MFQHCTMLNECWMFWVGWRLMLLLISNHYFVLNLNEIFSQPFFDDHNLSARLIYIVSLALLCKLSKLSFKNSIIFLIDGCFTFVFGLTRVQEWRDFSCLMNRRFFLVLHCRGRNFYISYLTPSHERKFDGYIFLFWWIMRISIPSRHAHSLLSENSNDGSHRDYRPNFG